MIKSWIENAVFLSSIFGWSSDDHPGTKILKNQQVYVCAADNCDVGALSPGFSKICDQAPPNFATKTSPVNMFDLHGNKSTDYLSWSWEGQISQLQLSWPPMDFVGWIALSCRLALPREAWKLRCGPQVMGDPNRESWFIGMMYWYDWICLANQCLKYSMLSLLVGYWLDMIWYNWLIMNIGQLFITIVR